MSRNYRTNYNHSNHQNNNCYNNRDNYHNRGYHRSNNYSNNNRSNNYSNNNHNNYSNNNHNNYSNNNHNNYSNNNHNNYSNNNHNNYSNNNHNNYSNNNHNDNNHDNHYNGYFRNSNYNNRNDNFQNSRYNPNSNYNNNNYHQNSYNNNSSTDNQDRYDHNNPKNTNPQPIIYHGLPMYKDKLDTAKDTYDIIQRGEYKLNDKLDPIKIKDEVKYCEKSTLIYSNQQDISISSSIIRNKGECKVIICPDSTLEAAKKILEKNNNINTAVLNFASATKPGGGWLNGRDAQEETITRQSALYASISKPEAYEGFYKPHENMLKSSNPEKNFYTDAIIYSPKVPVIRDADKEELLPSPFLVSFITSAATNLKKAIEDYQKFNKPQKKIIIPTPTNSGKSSRLPNIYNSNKPASNNPSHLNNYQVNRENAQTVKPPTSEKSNDVSNPRNRIFKHPENPDQKSIDPRYANKDTKYLNMNDSKTPQTQTGDVSQIKPILPDGPGHRNPRISKYENNEKNNTNSNDSSDYNASNNKNNDANKNTNYNTNTNNYNSNDNSMNKSNYGGSNNSSSNALNDIKQKNHEIMYKRCEKILKVCIVNQNKAIVLGAFGCGIFGNDPAEIADIFYDLLFGEQHLGNYLDYVVFAIKGASPTGYTFSSFQKKFQSKQ